MTASGSATRIEADPRAHCVHAVPIDLSGARPAELTATGPFLSRAWSSTSQEIAAANRACGAAVGCCPAEAVAVWGAITGTFEDPTIAAIAAEHGTTPAQVMLRWGLQHGRPVIPKSTQPTRIAENFAAYGFDLTEAQLDAIDGLDKGVRGGPKPEDITLEAFGRAIPEA